MEMFPDLLWCQTDARSCKSLQRLFPVRADSASSIFSYEKPHTLSQTRDLEMDGAYSPWLSFSGASWWRTVEEAPLHRSNVQLATCFRLR